MNIDLEKWLNLENEIGEWHKKVFVKADYKSQREKLKEEIKEFFTADTLEEKMHEMADVFFVLFALSKRFDCDIDAYVWTFVFSLLNEKERNSVFEEIEKKFEINKNRIWELQPNGTYHHVEQK